MSALAFTFHEANLLALGSGAVFWPDRDILIVSDLHLGKAARVARFGGAQLPPYEVRETLSRLDADLADTRAGHVICLGDSFDFRGLDALLPDADRAMLQALQLGREWTWVEGNHDPGPVGLPGNHCIELRVGPLVFRHIATDDGQGEMSGHYHPKARIDARGRAFSRPCLLFDRARMILPAYGTYTGGLWCTSEPLASMFGEDACAILTGRRPIAIPMPRPTHRRRRA